MKAFSNKWGLIFDVIADSNTQSRSRFITINGLDLKLFIKGKKEIHCQKQKIKIFPFNYSSYFKNISKWNLMAFNSRQLGFYLPAYTRKLYTITMMIKYFKYLHLNFNWPIYNGHSGHADFHSKYKMLCYKTTIVHFNVHSSASTLIINQLWNV